MGRNRFVKPDVVRLFLVDVHRRAYTAREEQLRQGTATKEDLARAAEALQEAEADGAFIDVKRQLNTGEGRSVFARMARDMSPGEKIRLDPEQVGMAKVIEYLVGWSFTDDDGKPVTLPDSPNGKEAVLKNLTLETFDEIRQAIDWHEEAAEAARVAAKNGQGSSNKSGTTSPSLVGVAGATETSAN